MDIKKFSETIDKIVSNSDNQALLTELASQLKEVYTQEATNKEALSAQLEEKETAISELKEANMKLYLKSGQPVQSEKLNETEPLAFEDLITEKGDIK